ncbi:hypothetical protein PF003_g11209 [Phytophthora fragariae]|uniref:Uncharacterized protein n=1 Tax=Phytophthora fragariae TaxID=53985 RepID=A0A6A3DJW2_9STRA|nr:hypothetical protein PF003_g11209 [Phytophthora fragariae]KAE8922172.1 hypothetical protein PF009_g27563 [Phytophthora fragariae]
MRGVLALLVNVLFVTALTIAFFLHTRRLRELTARLLGTVPTGNDHRPDTATRDAEKGFQVSAVCAFESFRDTLFCSTCGERMDTGRLIAVAETGGSTTEGHEQEPRNKPKRCRASCAPGSGIHGRASWTWRATCSGSA